MHAGPPPKDTTQRPSHVALAVGGEATRARVVLVPGLSRLQILILHRIRAQAMDSYAAWPRYAVASTRSDDEGRWRWPDVFGVHRCERMRLGVTGGRIEGADGAAAMLGLEPSTLRTRMARLELAR